jgi:hypothetical protein
MSHIQKMPPRSSKDYQPGQQESSHVGQSYPPETGTRITKTAQDRSDETRPAEIAGFPWQFVLLAGVIIAGLLGIVLRVVGVL